MSTRQSPISQNKNQSASKITPSKPEESKSLRPSAQKTSSKTTPVAEIKSASKRSVTPSGAKDRAPGTPTPKVTPFQEKGSAQQVRESSSKKNELTVPSASKNNQASANKKSPSNFQQTTLSPGSTKFVTRSANKDDVLPILEDLENEANKNGLSLDLRKDLNAILDDKSAEVKITATKIVKEYDVTPSKEAGQNRSSAKNKSQQKQVSDSNKSRDKSVTRLDLEGIEVRSSNRGSEVKVEENNGIDVEEEEEKQEGQAEEKSAARKEYSAYEDWRILETVEKEISAGGKVSRNFWNTIDDPLTGKRLLDGKRTSESMRDRYKRYIASLDDVGKDTLKEFAQNNDLETMKKYHCIFKKVGGLKQFMGVSDQLNYNPDRIQRKTPYGTKSQKEEQKADQKASTKRGGRKTAGQVERDFEEETFEHQMEEELGELEDDLFEIDEREITFATSEVRQAPVKTKQFEVQRPSQDMASKRKPNATSTRTIIRDDVAPVKRQERRAPARVEPEFIEDFEEEGVPVIEDFVSIDEAKRRALKRKVPRDDNYEAVISSVAPTMHREMKKVRITTHYDDSSLQLNDVFRDRKHGKPTKNVDQDNLMVLVDLSKGFRQFVREPEEDEREVENRKLRKLAEKYKIAFNEVVLIFRRVSYDYADLEEFLKRKDAKLLWTEEEDSDLLENNYTAIKYLKILKGEERVQKRMNYLMGNL